MNFLNSLPSNYMHIVCKLAQSYQGTNDSNVLDVMCKTKELLDSLDKVDVSQRQIAVEGMCSILVAHHSHHD